MSETVSNDVSSVTDTSQSAMSICTVLRVNSVAEDILGLNADQAAELNSRHDQDWLRRVEVEELFSKSRALSYPEWYFPVKDWEAAQTLDENARWLYDINCGLGEVRSQTKPAGFKVRKIHVETQKDGSADSGQSTAQFYVYHDNDIIGALAFIAQEMSSPGPQGSTVEVHCQVKRNGLLPEEHVRSDSFQSAHGPGLLALHGALDQLLSIQYGRSNYPCNLHREWYIRPTIESTAISKCDPTDVEDDDFLLVPENGEHVIVKDDLSSLSQDAYKLASVIYNFFVDQSSLGWSSNLKRTFFVTGSGKETEETLKALKAATLKAWPEPRRSPDSLFPSFSPTFNVEST